MTARIIRLGTLLRDADTIANLHTRSRQHAYRGLYGDHYLDHQLPDISRAIWRERFRSYAPTTDLILAAMEKTQWASADEIRTWTILREDMPLTIDQAARRAGCSRDDARRVARLLQLVDEVAVRGDVLERDR